MNITMMVVLAVSMASCKPDDCPPTPVGNTSPIVWKRPIESSTKTSLNSATMIYNDMVIMGKRASDNFYKITARNVYTGDSIWQVSFLPTGSFNPTNDGSLIVGDKLVFSSGLSFYVLNAATGEIVWFLRKEESKGSICAIDGYLYKVTEDSRNWSTLYRYDINTGAEEKLFTIHRSEYGSNYSPDLLMPIKWTHPSGDEILVLQNRTYGWYTTMESKMDILAWNLTADSMLWYRDSLDGFSSMARPAIDGDKVYFFGDHHAYCIDPLTGDTRWKYFIGNGPEDDFNSANILIVDDKLIVKPDNQHIHAVNKETGERMWFNENTAAMPYLLTVHKDTIWFASGGIFGIDAHTGVKLIDDWDNRGYGSWIFTITHHPTNGYIYTSDASYIYCLDPKYMKK